MSTNELKLLHSNPATRTEVFCDKEEHVTIVKPVNHNDGFPNKVTSGPCTCTDDHPQTPAAFEALGTPTAEPVAPDCSSAHTFAGMIKHCALKAGHTGLHDSGAQKWP
jgi:hypothetical protein